MVLTLSNGHNSWPSWILKSCHCNVRYFSSILDIIHPQKQLLWGKYGKTVNMVAGLLKCLISAFHHFLQPLFQNDQGRSSIPNFSLLTWYIVINKYGRLQNCLLWYVWRSICSLDIVDYVAPIIVVAAINGYKWHLSLIFMFFLKSSKLFVINLSSIFILFI